MASLADQTPFDDTASDTTRTNEPHARDFQRYESVTGEPMPSRIDGDDLTNLPSRTLSNEARLDEYTTETIDGQILKEVRSNATGNVERYELVTWKVNDPENPKNWSKAYKW